MTVIDGRREVEEKVRRKRRETKGYEKERGTTPRKVSIVDDRNSKRWPSSIGMGALVSNRIQSTRKKRESAKREVES